MAIIVEHEKRRHEILDKALEVFVDEGYEDATFQKIADKCGITRTTLYIYFKNKIESNDVFAVYACGGILGAAVELPG